MWTLGPWASNIAFILNLFFITTLESPFDPVLISCCLDLLLSSSLLIYFLVWVEHILLSLHEKGYMESRLLRSCVPQNISFSSDTWLILALLCRILGWIDFYLRIFKVPFCYVIATDFAVQKSSPKSLIFDLLVPLAVFKLTSYSSF